MQVDNSESEIKADTLQDLVDHAVADVAKGKEAIEKSEEHRQTAKEHYKSAEEHYKAAGKHIAECKKRYKKESNLTWAQFCEQHFGFTARRADQLIMLSDGRTTLQKMRDANSRSKRIARKKSEGRPSHSQPPRPEDGGDADEGASPEERRRREYFYGAQMSAKYAVHHDLSADAIDQEMADAAWKAANAWTATAQALSAAVAQGVTPAPIALVGEASASEGGA